MTAQQRILIVSNRLPCHLSLENNQWSAKPSAGGLVTALRPVLKKSGGVWVGWNGLSDEVSTSLPDLNDLLPDLGFKLSAVSLTKDNYEKFYEGFCNEIIWPLFHNEVSRCQFDPSFWDAYLKVNKIFAEKVQSVHKPDDFIWVQDFHLMELGLQLRNLDIKNRLGFFLHIPFPPPEIFLTLPWRKRFIEALLSYDQIGMQTAKDMQHFIRSVETLLPHVAVEQHGKYFSLRTKEGKHVTVGYYPISIDYDEFNSRAQSSDVEKMCSQIRKDRGEHKIIFGLERLDYTKGIINKLQAYNYFLENYPQWRGKVCLVQFIIPSRESLPEYKKLKQDIESLISEINGTFSTSSWIPIDYRHHTIDIEVLVAYYRVADVAVVTPLNDGMNLVAKEYCASQYDENGVLILSEFAGSAAQLGNDAILVNPYDTNGMAEAIHRALELSPKEAQSRMSKLRSGIQENDIYKWASEFLPHTQGN